ncbi:MAG TPA: hypothetical protein EYG68_01015, partial [Leucothrix mucor]|nr:hypothetical protein [Leucothrix mucor]
MYNISKLYHKLLNVILFLSISSLTYGDPRGRLLNIDSSSKYLIYYGSDFSQHNIDLMKTFDVVVLHPGSNNLTPAVVKELQDSGVSYVLGYISIGEDTPKNGELPILHQGKGPIYKDEATQEISYKNQGIASFYVDSIYHPDSNSYEHDGVPDTNGIFGGYYIYPNSDWHWVINEMRIGGSAGIFIQRQYSAGLKQIAGQRDPDNLSSKTANFGFDGFFLDTIDTAGPYTGEGWYPWAAEAMQKTVKFISDTYPNKTILANRGSFFFHAGLHNSTYDVKPIDFSISPYINAMLFESYMLDSDINHAGISPFFLDNHKSVMPKLMSEANRPDGFTVTGMDYMMNRPSELYDDLFTISVKENGWLVYLTLGRSIDTVELNFHQKTSDNILMQDTAPPQWMHTGEQFYKDKVVRVGIQRLKVGSTSGEMTVYWDSAKDQSWPIKYNIYIATQADFSDQVKHAAVNFIKNPAWNTNPANNVANQFTLTGLLEKTYYVRVRAEDSSLSNLEDSNNITLSLNLSSSDTSISNPLSQALVINGDLSDWQSLTSFGTDPKDQNSEQSLDWQQAWMAHDDDTIYLAYQYHNPLTMSWGHITYLDTDADETTGYKGSSASLPIGVEYMLQGYHLWRYSGSGHDWSWQY